MANSQLIEALGYRESSRFLQVTEVENLPPSELSFALRHTVQVCEERSEKGEDCSFRGAYVLQEKPSAPAVPVVYFFETESDSTAREIHRMVWNQNLVPFIIVASRSTVRVYPGFSFNREEDIALVPVINIAASLHELSEFNASSIDDGTIWKRWGHAADPSERVDESLLKHLKDLDRCLQEEGMERKASHGLIGKFVYLYYLRHRDILSDRKLEKWSIAPEDLFSRNATLKAIRAVNKELQEWLNGSVFQLAEDGLSIISQAQLRLAAGVFAGDSTSGQLHLDFQAYDFSHIPIETLSCVYEQFLHDAEETDGETRGKTLGAYYTPIPLTDYVISEMERERPLKEGMRVLDPSCGSGAFLVQCYRRLIEKKIRSEKRSLRTTELREILISQIFGIDRDDDACRVAELSLILTLLDYVTPPDLENTTFKLPSLRGANIFKDDFFDSSSEWQVKFGEQRFDWVVGNPPWAEVKGEPAADHEHFYASQWIKSHKTSHPTGGNQIAEAFLWKAGGHMAADSVAGLLVPAMTWFKKESVSFRKQFFSNREVWCLTNFANLAYVLFAGRAESPASAIFFRSKAPDEDHTVLTFAPFVAEQIANRPEKANKRAMTWNIVVNGSELRDVPNNEAVEGNGLTWKLAMWGSVRDARLLKKAQSTFDSLTIFCERNALMAHQGLELRNRTAREPLEYHRDLAGKLKIEPSRLRGLGKMFSFPPKALKLIEPEECYVRQGRADLPKRVSQPPHIVLDSSRRFAVFCNEFVAVAPRQIGIAGPPEKAQTLRALSLYLSSDFTIFHQFLLSPQWGIDLNLADLDTLRKLPIPLDELSADEMADWEEIHRELASLSTKRFEPLGWRDSEEQRFVELIGILNSKVFKALRIRTTERWLIEDFVHLHLQLNKGKVTTDAMRAPIPEEMQAYLTVLRDCLDGFLSDSRGVRHKLDVITGKESAFISIALHGTSEPIKPQLHPADDALGRALLKMRESLQQKHSQWLYFDRSLKIYHRDTLYQFKPMQRLHWTRRQAILDADDIIAEAASQSGAA